MSLPLKLFIDTNVWIDYYLERNSKMHRVTMAFIKVAVETDVVLYASTASMPDLFFLLCQETKRLMHRQGNKVDEDMAAVVREAAWSSLRNLMELAMLVPVSHNEALRAMTYREFHDDFEDNLILAAAARVDADYVVTSDKRLMHHALFPCVAPSTLLCLLKRAETT